MVALLILLIATFFLTSEADGNVTCSGTGMDWYTMHVGETACKTYERLRQICNPDFEVGTMSVKSLAPDGCNDQNDDCCCNSIAFALAMLCLNCQQDIGTTSGHDAANGAYGKYLMGGQASSEFCSPVHNQTFSATVQEAVCNQDIEIFDSLYSLFWASGAWFYIYTEDTISEQIIAQNNNTFTHCASTMLNNTTPNPTVPDDSSSRSRLKGGTIAGIVLGVVGGLAGFGLVLWFLWWNKRDMNRTVRPDTHTDPFNIDPPEAYRHLDRTSMSPKLPPLDVPLSQLENGPKLYSNQSPTAISPTATTTTWVMSSRIISAASPPLLGDNSEQERDDFGRVPQEMLDGRL